MLAYNRIWASGFPHLDSIPRDDRNCLWLLFTDPHWRKVLPDWEEASGRMVAQYRSAMAEHVTEPAWKALVARLQQASPDFVRVWARHDVQVPETYVKLFRHPEVGLLRLHYTSLWFGQRIGTRLSTYTPADEQTRDRLEQLHALVDARAA